MASYYYYFISFTPEAPSHAFIFLLFDLPPSPPSPPSNQRPSGLWRQGYDDIPWIVDTQ